MAADLNHNPVLNFDEDLLRSSADIGADEIPEITIYSVHRANNNTGGDAWIPWGNNDGEDDPGRLIGSYSATLSYISAGLHGLPGFFVVVQDLFVPLLPVLGTIFYDEDETDGSYARVNGTTTVIFTANHGPHSDNNLAIGSDGRNANYFDGDIAELIMLSLIHISEPTRPY